MFASIEFPAKSCNTVESGSFSFENSFTLKIK